METTVDTDLPWLTAAGLETLNRGYLIDDEKPLDLYKRVSSAAARRLHKPEMAAFFLEAMRRNWLCLATPVASNMGTDRGYPISCFGITVGDSVHEIFMAVHEEAMLTKMGGGVGINLNHVRGRGAPIKGNGYSEGIIPWMKNFDTGIHSVNQGQTRRGAGSLNLSIEHRDAVEFLRMRRPIGDINQQCLNLNHAFQVTDEFMQSLDDGHAENRRMWGEILKTRLETGEPYLNFIDTVNRANPEPYVKNGLQVEFTNICSEIALASDETHSFVCCLSSLNLARWDEWKDFHFDNHMSLPELATWFLDGVMQEFIDNAAHYPGFENAVRFATKSRALGLGVLGWHSLLQSKMLPFDTSVAVMGLNSSIFKFMQYESHKASINMGIEYGEPEWCRGTGLRNTHTMALAPTVSNALISGDLSPSIEPIVANAYTQKTAKGTFVYRNPTLATYLESIGQNKPDVWKSIMIDEGSVQGLDFLDNDAKEVFLTAREINQLHLIRQAAQRQHFIDQAQSLNLFFPTIPDDPTQKRIAERYFHNLHMEAWREGVKSLYYVRSGSVLKGDVASRFWVDDCTACEG